MTEAFWKELAKSGIQPDPGFRVEKLDFCIRTYRLPGLDYFARTGYEANVAELDRFYSGQLKKAPYSTKLEMSFDSTSGLRRQVRVINMGPGSKPGLNKVEVAIGFDVEPHVER